MSYNIFMYSCLKKNIKSNIFEKYTPDIICTQEDYYQNLTDNLTENIYVKIQTCGGRSGETVGVYCKKDITQYIEFIKCITPYKLLQFSLRSKNLSQRPFGNKVIPFNRM